MADAVISHLNYLAHFLRAPAVSIVEIISYRINSHNSPCRKRFKGINLRHLPKDLKAHVKGAAEIVRRRQPNQRGIESPYIQSLLGPGLGSRDVIDALYVAKYNLDIVALLQKFLSLFHHAARLDQVQQREEVTRILRRMCTNRYAGGILLTRTKYKALQKIPGKTYHVHVNPGLEKCSGRNIRSKLRSSVVETLRALVGFGLKMLEIKRLHEAGQLVAHKSQRFRARPFLLQTIKSFPNFPKLPKEIQRMIWKQAIALAPGRLIPVVAIRDQWGTVTRMQETEPIAKPVFFDVCSLSRRLAFDAYPTVFKRVIISCQEYAIPPSITQGPECGIIFRPEFDIIYVENIQDMFDAAHLMKRGGCRSVTALAHHDHIVRPSARRPIGFYNAFLKTDIISVVQPAEKKAWDWIIRHVTRRPVSKEEEKTKRWAVVAIRNYNRYMTEDLLKKFVEVRARRLANAFTGQMLNLRCPFCTSRCTFTMEKLIELEHMLLKCVVCRQWAMFPKQIVCGVQCVTCATDHWLTRKELEAQTKCPCKDSYCRCKGFKEQPERCRKCGKHVMLLFYPQQETSA